MGVRDEYSPLACFVCSTGFIRALHSETARGWGMWRGYTLIWWVDKRMGVPRKGDQELWELCEDGILNGWQSAPARVRNITEGEVTTPTRGKVHQVPRGRRVSGPEGKRTCLQGETVA